MDKKRSRGSNYTKFEKQLLINIAEEFSCILELKKTDVASLVRKAEAWKNVVASYNSQATTGPRTEQQLKMLYENLKRSAKKQRAEQNKHQYAKRLQEIEASEEDLQNALLKSKEDKKEMKQTGGGSYRAQVSDLDDQILAIIKEQVTPLQNPFDDAAQYFDNDNPNPEAKPPQLSSPLSLPPPSSPTELPRRPRRRRKITRRQRQGQASSEALKKRYFREKIKNALLQRRYMAAEHRMQMKVLNLQYAKLQNS